MTVETAITAAPGVREDFDVFAVPLDGVRLIEASAGTGKTWNICGLYLRLLLERALTVQQILVVTFTRAATAELKHRIRSRLVEMLAHIDAGSAAPGDPFVASLIGHLRRLSPDDALRQRLDIALQTFDEAAIFTIHGYCQRALADTPFAAAMPFALDVGESDDELCLEVSQDFWRKHVAASENPAALGALLARKGDHPERWARLLARMMTHATAELRWPESTDDGGLATLVGETEQAFARARQHWSGCGEDVPDSVVATLLDGMTGQLKANIYKPDAVRQAARQWQDWFAGGDPLAPLDASHARLELFSAARIRHCVNRNGTPPRHLFFEHAEQLLSLRHRLGEHLDGLRLRLLRRFLEEAPRRLRVLKRERRRITFDDILYNVHQALEHDPHAALARELHRRYPVALIDEFQDTDPLQFGIFRRIYRDEERHGTLFLVGDPKQAIYRFRNADLHTYLHARELTDQCYTLRCNQRSVEGLIQACNYLFQNNHGGFLLDRLAYDAVLAGEKPRKPFIDRGAEDAAALRLWWAPDDPGAENDGLLQRGELMQRAVRATAREIARLLRQARQGALLIGNAPLQPGDIAVLVRTHRQGAQVREALGRVGVGSVELSQSSVFLSPDAEALFAILQAVVAPTHQPALMKALASGLYGHDAAALQRLSEDGRAMLQLIERFIGWQEMWATRGIAVMLRQWMTEEEVAARLLARDDGERRLTNLLHLFECLHEAASLHSSPEALLRWLGERMRPDDGDALAEAAQLRLESDRNLVQIVTIHRAKGLEYAVVFCPFLWDGLPARPVDNDECLIYRDCSEPRQSPRTVADFRPAARDDAALAIQRRRENDAELVRLFYVALTRAIYRCYLVAGCYLRPVGRSLSYKESVRSLLNWLIAGEGRDHEAWLQHPLEPGDIRNAWQTLVSRASPHISFTPLPAEDGQRLEADELAGDVLPCPPLPVSLPLAWRIGSFSALNRDRQYPHQHKTTDLWDGGEQDGRDRSADVDAAAGVPDETAPSVTAPPTEDDILLFPRGPVAGDCIHAVFENIDFCDPASYAPAIAAALRAYPQCDDRTARNETDSALHARMLQRMLEEVLTAPLPEDIVLARIPREQKLVELDFYLPAPGLSSDTLNHWLGEHGYGPASFSFTPLQGYLRGLIDLVFEHRGRFYLLDWKSNHLGMTARDYAQAQVAAAMTAHGYHLQHLLYSVALHRHLTRTLPGYDPARHLGGVFYLFVRGVRAHWQADGAPCGVFFQRTPAAQLLELDRLLAGEPPRSNR